MSCTYYADGKYACHGRSVVEKYEDPSEYTIEHFKRKKLESKCRDPKNPAYNTQYCVMGRAGATEKFIGHE